MNPETRAQALARDLEDAIARHDADGVRANITATRAYADQLERRVADARAEAAVD